MHGIKPDMARNDQLHHALLLEVLGTLLPVTAQPPNYILSECLDTAPQKLSR